MANTHSGGPAEADGADFLRLGVNIDHVATVRNARGGAHPDPARAAVIAATAGADGLTIHLREDRRHIVDADLARIKAASALPINFEMAATEEMRAIALELQPNAVCLVPERREERTTEGGLDVAGDKERLRSFIAPLTAAGCRVSLFVEADPAQLYAAAEIRADIVELHTGAYCDAVRAADGGPVGQMLERLAQGATLAAELGLEPHAGHGIDYDTVGAIARIPEFAELNIGHFLIGEAIFVGLEAAVRKMRAQMVAARAIETATA